VHGDGVEPRRVRMACGGNRNLTPNRVVSSRKIRNLT
jgi:hypothetical protein